MQIDKPILILGGGNMGGALARCWHAARIAKVEVVETDAARRAALTAEGITCHADLAQAPQDCAALILAIKPQQFAPMQAQLAQAARDTLLISIMAGIPLASLQQVSPRAVRVMPNLPAMIGESMSVACAPALDAPHRALVTLLFEAVGKIAWVEEEAQLHAVTAISGSGPGYVFAFMEALEAAAAKLNLTPELARTLVLQTLRGAALLADQSPESATTLRQNVTSPGGTTQAALTVFSEKNLTSLVEEATAAAARRSRELAEK